MNNQLYIFFIFILNGFLIGILFDIFRILRKTFKTEDFITYLEDFLFWIITGFLVIFSLFKFNNGELRGYIFIGILFGVIIYILLFSKIFIDVNLYIINIIKKIIHYVIIIPIKALYTTIKKYVFTPSFRLYKYLRKNLSKLKDLLKKLTKSIKIKKDLT